LAVWLGAGLTGPGNGQARFAMGLTRFDRHLVGAMRQARWERFDCADFQFLMIYCSWLNYSTGLKIRIPTVGTIFIAEMKAKTAANPL
jgi:hypothetical protein